MSDLERLVVLANLQIEIQKDVDVMELALKKRKEDLRRVSEDVLPDLMLELGMSQFKLTTGQTVKIKEDFYSKIPDERFDEAVVWLSERGFAGIVKSLVTAPFGVGEKEQAEHLLTELQEEGIAAELKQTIHASTLKAFIRERLAAQYAMPFDLFGINPFNKSIIS